MCQIERLENREENGGNTPDRYRARAPWNSIKMHIYGFLQSTKGLKSPFHFEDGGYEIDSATLSKGYKIFKLRETLLSHVNFILGSLIKLKRKKMYRALDVRYSN